MLLFLFFLSLPVRYRRIIQSRSYRIKHYFFQQQQQEQKLHNSINNNNNQQPHLRDIEDTNDDDHDTSYVTTDSTPPSTTIKKRHPLTHRFVGIKTSMLKLKVHHSPLSTSTESF